jgi:hypothetical protein
MSSNQTDMCTWAVNNFPRKLKDNYAAWLKSNNTTIRDHLEYLLAKTLRDAGVDIPKFQLEELIERIRKRADTKIKAEPR